MTPNKKEIEALEAMIASHGIQAGNRHRLHEGALSCCGKGWAVRDEVPAAYMDKGEERQWWFNITDAGEEVLENAT